MKWCTFVIVASACASIETPPPAEQIGPGLGTTHVVSTRTIQPPALTAPPPEPVAPDSAQDLLAAADRLGTAPPEPHHDALVAAMHALADALDTVVPYRPADILRLRQTTDELERTQLRPGSHADLVRIALDAAAQALEDARPRVACDRERLRAAVAALRGAIGQIESGQPLGAQYPQLRAAIRASVRAVYAASGVPEPMIATASR